MDAKRIIPVLQLHAGLAAGPDPAVGPAEWARRLELEGADGILFQEAEPALPGARAAWLREVAGVLSIPFALEAPFQAWAELEEAMAAGVDQLVLAAPQAAEDPWLAAAVRRFGRVHVAVAVNAERTAGWRAEGRDALDWMAELERRGCGEILLRAEPEGAASAALVQGAAQLALSVLFRTGLEALAADALLSGADGIACLPARSPKQWKQALAVHGLAFRD
jgi:imidazole glycerol phosphate synthase subunit HisF